MPNFFVGFPILANRQNDEIDRIVENLRLPILAWDDKIPKFLKLAIQRVDDMYANPEFFPALFFLDKKKKKRREAREAIVKVCKALLRRMDMFSLRYAQKFEFGLTNPSMRTLVADTGMNQRRIERAVRVLKNAGVLTVHQPRRQLNDGRYVGFRAIRTLTTRFFRWLNLDKALSKIRKGLAKHQHERPFWESNFDRSQITAFLSRITKPFKKDEKSFRLPFLSRGREMQQEERQKRREEQAVERKKAWMMQIARLMEAYPNWTADQYKAKANELLGLSPDFKLYI